MSNDQLHNTAGANLSVSDVSLDVDGVASKLVSGGNSTFGWVATDGLENGKTLTVSSDTLTFNAPDKQVYLGFGMGWLYDNPVGTQAATHTIGAETISIETPPYPENVRKITEINGQRFLTGRAHNTSISDGGDSHGRIGFLAWDTGSEITHSDTAFQYAESRCTVNTEPNATLQWKKERIASTSFLSGDSTNSIYITSRNQSGVSPSGAYTTVVSHLATAENSVWGTPAPVCNGVMTSFALAWNPNTPDVADGAIYTRNMRDGATGFTLDRPIIEWSGSEPSNIISALSPERPRWVQRQDYIGNNTEGARDIDIDVTNVYWKINGDLFLLSDSPDLDLCVERPIPLIPLSFTGDNKAVTLNLWKGSSLNYSGKYLLHLDSAMTVLNTVEL